MGQPAELAKLAMILMLARWLAERRAPPATLRELIPACVIVGIPCGLVVLQPDLGSAIVFIAIMFAMLYWAGTKPSLLLLLGSPELGFLGVVVALALFVVLILVLLRVARRATDAYSSLCVFGVASLLFTHIVENVGMTVNLLPITGIPLPFFSYGGSFLLACSTAVGLSLRVAWESRQSGYAEL